MVSLLSIDCQYLSLIQIMHFLLFLYYDFKLIVIMFRLVFKCLSSFITQTLLVSARSQRCSMEIVMNLSIYLLFEHKWGLPQQRIMELISYERAISIKQSSFIQQYLNQTNMNPTAPKPQEELQFITKCQDIARGKGIDFHLLANGNPQLINQMLKAYSEKLIFAGETSAEKYLQQALVSAKTSIEDGKFNQQPIVVNHDQTMWADYQMKEFYQQGCEKIFFDKATQNTFEQKLNRKQMDARINIFSQQLGRDFIKQKIASFNSWFAKIKQCLPIQTVVQNKITSLKTIFIQYQIKPNSETLDRLVNSVTAFDIFKVIHSNKQLKQIIINGVKFGKFSQFLRQLRLFKQNLLQGKSEVSWLKEFQMPKPLKIAVKFDGKFEITDKYESQLQIRDLEFYSAMLDEISDISVTIILGRWSWISYWVANLKNLLKYLKTVKRIEIQLLKVPKRGLSDCIDTDSVGLVRSILFGGLAQFTEIVSLSFKEINFHPQFNINSYLAIQQCFSTIFSRNKIIHLQLDFCDYFPIVPKAKWIRYDFAKMRHQKSFMSTNPQTNQYLQKIRYFDNDQQWRIDDKLFNQLQSLLILYCSNAILQKISPLTPSNIKYLSLYKTNIGDVQSLSKIFPKLFHLTHLHFDWIQVGFKLISLIPSKSIEELYMRLNSQMTNQGLIEIDKKWPLLKILRIDNCRRISEKVWSICKFRGLVRLTANEKTLGSHLSHLQRRGIQISHQY